MQMNNLGGIKFARPVESRNNIADIFDFRGAFAFLRRRAGTIVAGTVACLLVAAVYVFTSPNAYTSTARIYIDSNKVAQADEAQPGAVLDSSTAESQVEIISSENVLLPVAQRLKLGSDPSFLMPPRNIFAETLSFFKSFVSNDAGELTADQKDRWAAYNLGENLQVRRIGVTYVLELNYRALDPRQAATIVNAIAQSYVDEQIKAKFDAAHRASAWMQDRISELREQANAAARAVQEYKTEHNLIDTNKGSVGEQQLSEVTSQLVNARAETGDAKARLDRASQLLNEDTLAGNLADGTVTDALKVDVISKLRQQLLEASMREADVSSKYGQNHQVAVRARDEVAQLRRSLRSELQRITEGFKSDYAIAKSRQESLEKAYAQLVTEQGVNNQARVHLRELESAAQTYAGLYESFLRRQTEVSQAQSFPLTEARIITPGGVPSKPSHPRVSVIMALALAAGGMFGLGLAVLREALDGTFTTPEDLERFTGLRCISILPLVEAKASQPPRPSATGGLLGGGALSFALTAPFSAFAEGIRSAKLSIDLSRQTNRGVVVGITSSVPDEGKSTVAANLAQAIALSGRTCLLIDSDLRNPSLSRAVLGSVKGGLSDLLADGTPLENVIREYVGGKLYFLPARRLERSISASDLLGSERMKLLLTCAAERFDYVILDLPPLAPIIDVRSVQALLHRLIVTVEWGATDQETLRRCLGSLDDDDKILGTVLNKIPIAALKKYPTYRSDTYLHHH